MGLTLASQIKSALQRAKAYTSSHVSTLAQATAELFEEVDLVKANKPVSVPVTIPTTGWQTDNTEDSTYPQYYDIPAEGVTAKDIPTVCVAPESQAAASACGMCQTCETVVGAIRIRAASAPTSEIQAEYVIEEGRAETTAAESEGE